MIIQKADFTWGEKYFKDKELAILIKELLDRRANW